ncbi:MAG: pyridoxamine 5'-phosphate oxidase family protein [Elusimicrobiota bacterium]|jgi:nitroimidazol reductase NimA-like FMN-containing flavoprotein (pyridoxamine 5'-phosphate oxidase superfamily)|nr:pyridoxamine 5'-phosphate oxidase family protein [Elusimicrobiota bacterium]
MRRKDKEITDISAKIDIIDRCKVCRLGLSDKDQPYVIPLNYGYSFSGGKLTLFFHGAKEGMKVDIIKRNNRACFEMDCDLGLIVGDAPHKYSYAFKSIIGFGKITILESHKEKTDALNEIMKHQTGKDTRYTYPDEQLDGVLIYKVDADEFSGKHKEFPKKES